MKGRALPLLLVIILIAAVFYWFPFHQQTPVEKTAAIGTNNLAIHAKTSIVTNPVPIFAANTDTNSLTNAVDIADAYHQGLISKDEAVIRTMLEKNRESQDFYGKVIDQYGDPVAGVDVTGNLMFISGWHEPEKHETYKTQSNSQGLFQFTDLKGWQLGIMVRKDGYKIGGRGEGFQAPTGGKSSPSNRAILTMWKLRGPEPLNNSTIEAKIPHDGTPVVFNIASGKQSPNGNFLVTLSQYPLEVKHGWDRFDWSVKVEILNGGLVEENDAYPYWAPVDGYQPSFEFNESTNAVKWLGGLQKKFYIKTAQGQYGIMQFGIYPGRSPTGMEAHFTINPSGSRNLEPKE